EFTVNVALIEDGEPVLGVILAPALGRLFLGAAGVGAFLEEAGQRRRIHCRRPPAAGLTVVASRSHGDAATLDAFLAGRNAGHKRKKLKAKEKLLAAAGGY
ncbi:3'(2'),5'-bisphosphate nucleotidase CysQ, partial [Citrobacter sp. AAK_AS5]